MWEWNSEHLASVYYGNGWTFAVSAINWGLPIAINWKRGEYWGLGILCFYIEFHGKDDIIVGLEVEE